MLPAQAPMPALAALPLLCVAGLFGPHGSIPVALPRTRGLLCIWPRLPDQGWLCRTATRQGQARSPWSHPQWGPGCCSSPSPSHFPTAQDLRKHSPEVTLRVSGLAWIWARICSSQSFGEGWVWHAYTSVWCPFSSYVS